MSREVRPAFGPFVEAVPLLVRQETLEVAAILAVLPMALSATRELLRLDSAGELDLPGGIPISLFEVARAFGDCLLWVASVLLLLPVACGERGLRPRVLFEHFGALALAASVYFGASVSVGVATFLLSENALVVLVWFGSTILQTWLAAWAAWFLWSARRKRDGLRGGRPGLLVWPGAAAGFLPGLLAFQMGSLLGMHPWAGRLPLPRDLLLQAMCLFLSHLLFLFAAFWMVRALESEAVMQPVSDTA